MLWPTGVWREIHFQRSSRFIAVRRGGNCRNGQHPATHRRNQSGTVGYGWRSHDSIIDLYAWQFDINFDPGILATQAVTEDDFLSTGGPTCFLPGTIDNGAGTIIFNGDTLEGNLPGVSGSGLLAQVQFEVIALGTSPVGLASVSLLDSGLNNIDAATMDGSIASTPTPEPSPRWPFACCLLALLLARKPTSGLSLASVLLVAGAVSGPVRAADIPTGQFDAARTMAYGSEIYLTTSTVNSSHFGKLFTRTVDGAIFAQPLYLQGMVINSRKVNVVYVATSHNNVYAFDADDPNASTPIWSVNLGQYDTPGWNTGVGILSTPQIVRGSNAFYLAAATNENGGRVYRLHALDLLTGAEKFGGPVVIAGSVPGTAGDSVN